LHLDFLQDIFLFLEDSGILGILLTFEYDESRNSDSDCAGFMRCFFQMLFLQRRIVRPQFFSARLARTCAAAHDGGNVADGWLEAPVVGGDGQRRSRTTNCWIF